MRFIFFGSSEFAEIVLKELLQAGMKPVLVITQPPKPQGRKKILSPTPVQIIAEQNKIPLLTPSNLNEEAFLKTIKNLNTDFALLTAYGKIIPTSLLQIPKKGFINLHPSLLPKFRGATPIQSAILEGVTETGATLFLMDEQIDHGPIIQNTKYTIQNPRITYLELLKQLAKLGAKLIIKAIPQWLSGQIIPYPQDESLASYCRKLTKEDEKINWHVSAIEIDRKVRALNPNPGTYTIINNRIIKITQGSLIKDDIIFKNKEIKQIGEVFETPDHKLAVKCLTDSYQIDYLKPEGKKDMSSYDFLMGNRWILGQIAQ